MTGSGNSQHL